MKHKLFSYGTLQFPQVQEDTFGRLLQHYSAEIPGFTLTKLEITDPDVIASSGKTFHPIAKYTGLQTDILNGAVMLITDTELANADTYEVSDYQRIEVATTRLEKVWIYIDKHSVSRYEQDND